MRSRGRSRSTAEVVREALELPPARRRVLDAVAAMPGPSTVAEIAEALDCHVSTARPHLGALAAAGLLTVGERRLGDRGRPAVLYSTRLPDPARIHQGLISLVNSGLEKMGPEEAYDIGLSWGTDERRKDYGSAPGASPQEVVAVLTRLGFDPVWENATFIHVRGCPLAHRSPDEDRNLWELHRGLFEGLLGEGHGTIAFHPDDPRGGCRVEFLPASA